MCRMLFEFFYGHKKVSQQDEVSTHHSSEFKKKKKRKKKEKKKKRLYPNLPQLKTRMWKFLWDFCYAPRHSRAFPWFQLYWYLAHQLDLRGNFTIPTLLLVTIIPLLMQTGLHVIIILSHILVTHSRYIEQSITLKFLVFFFYFTFSC